MKDIYERLNQINQVLHEYGAVPPVTIAGKKARNVNDLSDAPDLQFIPSRVTDPKNKLKLTGDQGSARMYKPDADAQARMKAAAERSRARLAGLEPGMAGYNSRAAQNARFQKGMQDTADTARNVAIGAASMIPVVKGARLAAPLLLALGRSGIGKAGLAYLGMDLAGRVADKVLGGGDKGSEGGMGGEGGDASSDTIKDLKASSYGTKFKQEYGGKSISKLRGR